MSDIDTCVGRRFPKGPFINYNVFLDLIKVCIIRLDHICFEKSSSTFWQVRCCAHRTQRSCQKYDEDFFKFCCLLRKPKLYDLKSFEFLSRQEKKLEKLLVVGISGFVELAFTFSFNKQRPSYTEKRWIHNSSGKPNYSNFDSTYIPSIYDLFNAII